jgi:DNA end-binding protein Ku
MAQAVWTGTLSFGLVSIPVKLYGATRARDVRFHQFEGRTGRRVRYRRVANEADVPLWEGSEGSAASWGEGRGLAPQGRSETTPADEPQTADAPRPEAGTAPAREPTSPSTAAEPEPESPREVAFEDVVRGFEVDPGRFVPVTEEELAELAPEPSRSIDIEDFVRLEEIDPVYFERSYHVVPDRGGETTYRLLVRAMEEAGRVAIGRFVLRTREHLAAVRPSDGSLMLETLFRADEVRPASELYRLRGEDPSDRETQLAMRLIEALTVDWDPERYPDTYRERVLEFIQGKAGPRPEVVEPAAGEAQPAVFDLMEALKRSVEEARTARGRSAKGEPAPRPARRRRTTG